MANDFVKEFNRRLGQYTGDIARPTPDAANQMDLGARLQNMEQAQAVAKFSDYLQKTKNKPKPTLTGSNVPALGNLSQESVDLITKAGSNKGFMGVDFPNIWEIPGPVGKALGPIDEFLIGLNIQAPLKLGTTALDALARPAYGVFNAQKQQAESYNRGEGFGQQLENLGSGFWQGFKGDEKTGFGAAVEEWSKTPEELQTGGASGDRTLGGFGQMLFNATVGAGFPRLIAEEFLEPGNDKGAVNTWAKRGLGLFGEVALDPTNLVGGGAIAALKGPGDELAEFAQDAYRQLAKDAARQGIDDAGWTQKFGQTPQLRGPSPTGQGLNKLGPKGFDYIDELVEKSADDAMFEVKGGASRRKLVGQNQAPYAIANNVGIGIRHHMTTDLDNLIHYFREAILQGKRPSSAQIRQLRTNPGFDEFLDELLILAKKDRPSKNYADIERALLDYARNPGPGLMDNIPAAQKIVKGRIDDTVVGIQNKIHDDLLGAALNVPGISVAGKTLKLNKIGKMYQAKNLRKLEKGGGSLKGLKYGDTFVGRTPQVAQRVRSLGMKRYEEFHRDVTDMVNGRTRVYDINTRKMKVVQVANRLTKAERKTIHENILRGTVPQDPRLREAQEFVIDAYKKIWQEEVDAGVPGRSSSNIQADNYVFNYYKGSDVKNRIDKFKKQSKRTLAQSGSSRQLDPDIIQKAKAAHLNPEEDAFKALLYRKLDSNRQLTKTWFKKDLLDNYGVMGNQLSDNLINQMKLEKQFEHGKLPEDIQKKLGMTKAGDAWYLPQDINDVYKAFEKLSGGKPEELQGIIRLFDTWTRYFKTAATIPWPGFHIRNGIGDIFMSWIDGVRAKDVAFLKSWEVRARSNPNAKIDIGGMSFTFDQMRNLFRESASSGGYQNVELISEGAQTGLGQTAKDLARQPQGVGNLARRASGAREDLFRFTHFLHAMREELPGALAKSGNQERALRQAIDASTYRVNKYLFDYGALTRVEQTYLKRAIPFYTYTRKAIPTLIESMFLHPSQFAKTQRWALDSDDSSYNDMLTPQYQRDIGYARLSDEDDDSNPWILGGQFLPTDVLNRNTNFGNFKEFAQNLSAQTNPFMKLLYERGGGRQYFNDQPIESTGQYLTDALVPPLRPLADVPNFPGTDTGVGEWTSKLPFVGESSKEGWLEKILSGRVGAGLPFDKVNEGQQSAAAYGVFDEIKKRFNEVNGDEDEGTGLAGAGYKIYPSLRKDGSTFRIKRLSDDTVVYESTDPQKVMQKAQSLMD